MSSGLNAPASHPSYASHPNPFPLEGADTALDSSDLAEVLRRDDLETVQPGGCLTAEDRTSGRPIEGCSKSPECGWISGWRNTRPTS
jgi:hypothetical protein